MKGIQREGDFGWIGTFLDTPIRESEGMWAATFQTGGSQNFGKYSNPEFDAVMDQLKGRWTQTRDRPSTTRERRYSTKTPRALSPAAPATCLCGIPT